MGIGAAVIGAGALGAGANIFGSVMANKAQQDAAAKAQAYLQQMFGISQTNLQPWINNGQNAGNTLATLTGVGGNPMTAALTRPFQPTMEQLSQTPGYQFSLGQGLKAVQNSAAASGLGKSGSALAGAASYATGLAGTTYQSQFNNDLQSRQFILNALTGQSGLGESAAGTLGQIGAGTGANLANTAIGAGSAAAGMWNGIGNALSNGVNGIANNYSNLSLLGANNPALGNKIGWPASGYGTAPNAMTPYMGGVDPWAGNTMQAGY